MSNTPQMNSSYAWQAGRFGLFGSRWIPLLALLLLAQLALTALVYWPRSNATSAGEPLLAGFDPAQVQAVTITDGNESSLRVARQGEGWVLPAADDFPVKGEKVTGLLDKIAALQRERLVGSQATTLAQLNVSDDSFTRRIAVEMADGATQTLYVGDGPRFRTSHVRLGGENSAYLSLDFSPDDSAIRMGDWIDVSFVSIAEASIQKMTLENANGVFDFYRDAAGQWQMAGLAEGESFNPNNLISLLTTLSALNMAEPLGKEKKAEYGLEAPTVRVAVEYTDATGAAQSAEIRIGALDDSQSYYVVSSSESPYLVHISKFSLDRFIERTRDEFLQQPPTPTPAP